MSPAEIKNQIIADSTEKLKNLDRSKGVVNLEYRNFLKNLSFGKCPNCFKELEIIEAKWDSGGFHYKYACGHGWSGIQIKENIKVRESIELTQRPSGKQKFSFRMFQGYRPSGDPNLSEGVEIHMIVDRTRNEYHQVVKDNKTGKILHEEHEPLNNHRPKGYIN